MGAQSLKNRAASAAVKAALAWLDRDPAGNLLKLLNLIETFDNRKIWAKQLNSLKKELEQKSGILYDLVIRGFRDISKEQRNRIAEIFIFQVLLIGNDRADQITKRYGGLVPWTIFPSSAHSVSELEKGIQEVRALGVHLLVFPENSFQRTEDILHLGERYPDMVFFFSCSPREINRDNAERMRKLLNCLPAVRNEQGSEEAFALLRRSRLMYGSDTLSDAETVYDRLVTEGAVFVLVLMEGLTQEEYSRVHERLTELRMNRPVMTLEFWRNESGKVIRTEIGIADETEPCTEVEADVFRTVMVK